MSHQTSLSSSAPNPKRWLALGLLCAAQFIVILDTSIIGVALPAIQNALDYSQANLQWIFNAYVIIFGGFLLLGGRLSDLFGTRQIFMAGFAILTAGSLLAGLADSEWIMNFSRGIQGFGAALIAPSAMTMLVNLFMPNPKELNKAFGFWGASAAAGGSAGVFFGGIITQWLDWRWIFFIYVPVGILVLILSPILLKASQIRKGKMDIIGALTITTTLLCLVYAIVQAEQVGWSSLQTLSLIIVSVILLILFLILQTKLKEPLIPLRIFSSPNLSLPGS